ncbi:MAG TPA: hypothetical protein VF070_39620 [Streptosporangiaceae bacterium]
MIEPAAAWPEHREPAGVRRPAVLVRGPLVAAAALVLFAALAVLFFLPAWSSPHGYVIGDSGDSDLFIWYLRWPGFALSHGWNPLVSNYLDYPDGINLMWNVSIVLPALLMTPITSTFGPIVSYNALLTIAVALSTWTAFLAIRRYVSHPLAAGLGALLYGFSPYLLGHALGHLQASILFIPPLVMIALDEIAVPQRRPPWVSGLLLGSLAAAQLLISEEVLATTALAGLLGLGLLAAIHRERARRHLQHAVAAFLFGASTFAVLAAFPLAIQFFGPQRMGGSLQPTPVYSNDLLNFIVPTSLQWLDPAPLSLITSHFTGNVTEWNGYLGIPLLIVCALVCLRFWRRPIVPVAAGVGGMMALLSLGWVIHIAGWVTLVPVAILALAFLPLRSVLPGRLMAVSFVGVWLALAIAPLYRNLLPARLMLPVYLLAGIMLAIFAEWVLKTRRKGMVLGLAALAAVIVSLFPRIPYPAGPLSAPIFFDSTAALAAIPDGSVALVLPFSRGDDARAMFWQAESGMRFRMPEAYAYVPGPAPAEISPPPSAIQDVFKAVVMGHHPAVTAAEQARMLAELRDWKVRTIIVGPMEHEEEAVVIVTALLGKPSAMPEGVYLWPVQALEP